MKTSVQKWGNSLGLRIPAAVARSLDLKVESKIDLQIEEGRIILTPQRKKKQYELSALLELVTPDNQPGRNVLPGTSNKDI